MVARKDILSLFLVLSLTINPFIIVLNAGTTTQSFMGNDLVFLESKVSRDPYSLRILYDASDAISIRSAEKLLLSLSVTDMILTMEPVLSAGKLAQLMRDSWMNIYIFHGTSEGMVVGSDNIPWESLSSMIESSRVTHHIFDSCFSNTLRTLVSEDVSVYGLEEQVDAEVAYFGVLCEMYDILDTPGDAYQEKLADSIFDITTAFFLQNLDSIFERSLEPKEPMAEIQINYGKDKTDSRGPWGWMIDAIMTLLLNLGFGTGGWYTITPSSITFDTDKINAGQNDTGDVKLEDMGNGNSKTGEFPFDIPLELDIDPRLGKGPWYMPDYVDLVFTIQAKNGKLDLAQVLGLKKILEAAGYSITLELTPKIQATLRIGNYVDQIETANPNISDNPFKFMGGSMSVDFGFEFGIPLATFLDYVIPGSGTTISKIMKALNMKVNLVNYLSLALGMNYDAVKESSKEDVTLKAGFGLDISISLPSLKKYIKDAIGISLPLDFITLGAKLKATTGVLAKASFGPKGDSFVVGLFYKFFFKFYASLFWFFKFSVEKKWEDDITFPLYQSEGTSNPPSTDHALLDLDNDGLNDDLEIAMGLDPTLVDTDGDSLSDGNELLNYFTDPLDNDTDDDGLIDSKELVLWYAAGLDPLADYDNDGTPSIMDYDSDNDGINDKDELEGINSGYWLEVIKTNPSLPDTDFDGFTDGEEWAFAGVGFESPHPDPRMKDTDSDGLWDKFEYDWYDAAYGRSMAVMEILTTDMDADGLNDGLEFSIGTSPIDIDTDGDFDLDNDNVINATEQARAVNNFVNGDFTDYGEYYGNTWVEWPWALEGCTPPNPTPTNPLRADSDYDLDSDVVEYTNGTFPCLYDSDGDGLWDLDDVLMFGANCTDPDTDDDYIRDGDEVRYYNTTRGIANETIIALGYLSNPDVDNDGIVDGLELRLGTDPLNNDTDSDGLLDGLELVYGTYPTLPDSDMDTILDGIEVLDLGTNPLRKDTDNDGLSDDFEIREQTLYILYQGNFTYHTDPNDPDTDDDTLTDGEEYYGWNWATDRRVQRGALVIDEPLKVEGDEDILNVTFSAPDPYRARFQTHPANPDTDFDGLEDGLEKAIVLSPVTHDTDADGWPDVDEIQYMVARAGLPWTQVADIWHYHDYDGDGVSDFTELNEGTDMLLPDSDFDGLDDWTELFIPVSTADEVFGMSALGTEVTVSTNTTLGLNRRYTSPLVADTDFDGLSDWDEVMNGTDPLDPDTDHDGLTDYEELMVFVAYEGFMTLHKVTLDPFSNDTDSDGILDHDEVILWTDRETASGNPLHGPLGDFDNDGVVNLFDYDSDSDGIYDGFEVYDYQNPALSWYPLGTDPFNSDQNLDGIIDGISTDYDGDGLADNTELGMIIPGYTYTALGDENSTYGHDGHILNHTLVALADSDGDGYDDGWEISFGSDPLNPGNYPHTIAIDLSPFGPFFVNIMSSSNVENFMFNEEERQIDFDVSGPDDTLGFCNLTIPLDLLRAPEGEWEVFIDGEPWDYSDTVNATSTMLYFSYIHSEHHISIRGAQAQPPLGEFDPFLIIIIGSIAGVVVIILVIVMKKMKTPK